MGKNWNRTPTITEKYETYNPTIMFYYCSIMFYYCSSINIKLVFIVSAGLLTPRNEVCIVYHHTPNLEQLKIVVLCRFHITE